MKSRYDFLHGQSLPSDFRFRYSSLSKTHHNHAFWRQKLSLKSFFTILTQILCIKVVEYDSVIVFEILYIYSSPSKGCHGPRSAWGGEIGGTGVDSFGSPGTALVRSQTQVPSTENSKNSSNPCTEQLRSVDSRILCEILMLTKLLSSWINVRQLLHFTVQMLVPVKWIDSRIQFR